MLSLKAPEDYDDFILLMMTLHQSQAMKYSTKSNRTKTYHPVLNNKKTLKFGKNMGMKTCQ